MEFKEHLVLAHPIHPDLLGTFPSFSTESSAPWEASGPAQTRMVSSPVEFTGCYHGFSGWPSAELRTTRTKMNCPSCAYWSFSQN